MKMKSLAIFLCLLFINLPLQAANLTANKAPPVINLNTADAKALFQSVKGIGKKRAEAIIKYRETHGKFKSIDDLAAVPGLGKNFVSKHLGELKATFLVN